MKDCADKGSMKPELAAGAYIRRWNEINGMNPDDIVISYELRMFVEWVIRQERGR